MNPIVMKEMANLKMRITELEEKISEFNRVMYERQNEANTFEELMSDSAEIDSDSTSLICNIASTINFEGISAGLSFGLNDVGSNFNFINNKTSEDINNQISDENIEIERMREEIRELEIRLEGLKQAQFF